MGGGIGVKGRLLGGYDLVFMGNGEDEKEGVCGLGIWVWGVS